MQLRALVSFAGPEVGAPALGSVFECADHVGAELVRIGFAEEVVPTDLVAGPDPVVRRVTNPKKSKES